MLLTADIGNTNITLGLFDENALVEEFRLASDKDLSLEEYEVLLKSLFKDFSIDGCIISSVVSELNEKFKNAVGNVFKLEPLFLSVDINTGIKVALKNPLEAGLIELQMQQGLMFCITNRQLLLILALLHRLI